MAISKARLFLFARYAFFDRIMIGLIMWITAGPTDPQAVVDFTDRRQVEAFARLIGVRDPFRP